MTAARPDSMDLQQLALLNQEIAALVRAGIPLESGLVVAGKSAGASLEVLKSRLAQRLSEGRSLTDAVQSECAELPPLYRAVLEAGLRSGRVAEALESLANLAQESLQLRRRLDMVLLYPSLVVLLMGGLFAGVINFWTPKLTQAFDSMRLPLTDWVRIAVWLRENFWFWSWIIPGTVVSLTIWWWCSTRGRYGIKGSMEASAWSAFQVFPGVRSILTNFRRANFCNLWAMLLSHQVPLLEAAVLAGEASGDSSLTRLAKRVADGARAGHSVAECLANERDLPPFVLWMMITGDRQGHFVRSLKQVAEVSRQRAASQSDWLRLAMPTGLVLFVGGPAVLFYALSVFVPLAELFISLGKFDP